MIPRSLLRGEFIVENRDYFSIETGLEMMDKETRKNIKRIQKELERLKEEFKKIELRPCNSDAELRQKDEEVKMLKREMFELDKEAKQYELYVAAGRRTK